MPRVMVMGKHAAVLPFKAVGVEIVDAEEVEAVRGALHKLVDTEDETLLLLPEDLALGCAAEIKAIREAGTSVVVMTLPALSGEVGAQREQVRQLVARSIGVDLMGKK